MDDNLNLDELKARLAKLGVHVSPNPVVSSSSDLLLPVKEGGAKRSLASQFERHKTEVVELLDRCTKVEAGLHSATAAVDEAKDAVHGLASPLATSPAAPERSPSPQPRTTKAKAGKPGAGASSSSSSSKAKRVTLLPVERSALSIRSPEHGVSPPLARPKSATAVHTPLSTVLAQYKEAETFWAQEKAKLRREAVAQRKRASKLELELQRLQRLHDHRGLDLRALKAALKSRDQQIQALSTRLKDLEDVNTRVQELATEKLAAVAAERDDIKAMLMATLQRLEAIEDVVQRADVSSARMEEKVKVLEEERGRAVEAATRARAEAAELAESRKRLQWQSRLLEKMSEVQLNHNRRKSEALRELLQADDQLDQQPTPASLSTAPSEAGDTAELLAKYAHSVLSPSRRSPV